MIKVDGNEKYSAKNYEDALILYEKALIIYQKFCPHLQKTHGEVIDGEITKIMSNMAKAYSQLGRHDEAIAFAEKAIAFAQQHNVADMLEPGRLPKTLKELCENALKHCEKDNWVQKLPLLNKLVDVMTNLKQDPKVHLSEIERLNNIKVLQQSIKQQVSGLQPKPTKENTAGNNFSGTF